jgi:hypothetical protein
MAAKKNEATKALESLLGGLYSHLRRLVNRYNIGTTDIINHGVLSDSQKGNKNNG